MGCPSNKNVMSLQWIGCPPITSLSMLSKKNRSTDATSRLWEIWHSGLLSGGSYGVRWWAGNVPSVVQGFENSLDLNSPTWMRIRAWAIGRQYHVDNIMYSASWQNKFPVRLPNLPKHECTVSVSLNVPHLTPSLSF